MKVSVIIPLYKNLDALKLILEALRRQTYKKFEVIIAEDDDAKGTVDFLKDYSDLDILHISQPDTERNKVMIQNKAICKSNGDYLFFIDGDIIPYKHFIEYSLKIAKPKRVLAGRRVNLDEKTTALVKDGKINIEDMEANYLLFYIKNFNKRDVRAEQGIELDPDGFIYKILSMRKRNNEILGCNFSCFKEDFVSINGFNEEYHPRFILADDADLTWRFEGIGCELYSSKNIANCFHLYHELLPGRIDTSKDKALYIENQKNKRYICKVGLNKYCNFY